MSALRCHHGADIAPVYLSSPVSSLPKCACTGSLCPVLLQPVDSSSSVDALPRARESCRPGIIVLSSVAAGALLTCRFFMDSDEEVLTAVVALPSDRPSASASPREAQNRQLQIPTVAWRRRFSADPILAKCSLNRATSNNQAQPRGVTVADGRVMCVSYRPPPHPRG